MTITKTPETQCPSCNHVLDGLQGEEGPVKGDLSICIYCQAVLVLNDDMTVRIIEEEEWNELSDEARYIIARERLISRMRRIYQEMSNN